MPEQVKDEKTLQRQAYTNATTRLREENLERFKQLRVEEAQKLGIVYTPKLTPEEKAREDLRALIREHPHLADEVDDLVAEAEAEGAEADEEGTG
jgi:hypothetical protein